MKQLAEEILNMSLLDVSDLTDILKDRLGVSGMPIMGMGGGGGMAAPAPEGTAGDGSPPSTPPCRSALPSECATRTAHPRPQILTTLDQASPSIANPLGAWCAAGAARERRWVPQGTPIALQDCGRCGR